MSRELRSLAAWLLAQQPCGSTSASVVGAAEGVLAGIRSYLRVLIGPEGYRTLLVRALERTRTRHPLLASVRIHVGEEAHLDGIHESARGRDPEEARAALEHLIAELLGLASRLLGADLVLHVLQKEWRDLPYPFPGEDSFDDAVESQDRDAADGRSGAG